MGDDAVNHEGARRQQRLAEALRWNLKRRKAQARGRAEARPDGRPGGGPEATPDKTPDADGK